MTPWKDLKKLHWEKSVDYIICFTERNLFAKEKQKFSLLLSANNSTLLKNDCNLHNSWTLDTLSEELSLALEYVHVGNNKDHEKQFPVPVESCHVYPMGIRQIHQMLYQLSSRAWAMDTWGKPWGDGGKSNSQKWHSFPMSQRSRKHWLLNYPNRFVVHQQDHKSHRSFRLVKKKSFED